MRSRRTRPCARVLARAAALAGGLLAAGAAAAQDDLGRLSIEELSQIRVTSVSKRPEPVGQAASSVYVITGEAIARSGAMSLPEALRLAPNLAVMRIDALDYTITARGFSGFESANKLLVMVDGRSVYSTLFSGVDWDQHHLLLDDVDRIEVISGPGGTLWGANAVNGVVNVTTKSAFDTEGVLAAANLGTLDSDVRLRVGRRLGETVAGRVYATGFRRGDLETAGGADARDGWDGWQAGLRLDVAADRQSFTLQGDVLRTRIDESAGVPDGYVRTANALARWQRRFGETTTLEAQAYYDYAEREARLVYDERRVWDLEARGTISVGRHHLVAGAGYRVTRDEFRTLFDPQLLSPTRRRTEIGNVFVSDEIALTSDLLLTVGVKLETNSYTSKAWSPSARLAWRISERQFAWAAVSRAVRNPSRIERDFTFPGLVIPGQMGPEELVAYEAGWRGRITDRANASVTVFHHDYDDLRTNEALSPDAPLPGYVGNGLKAQVSGVEAWADLQITDGWRISIGGSVLDKDFELDRGSLDISQREALGADPRAWGKLNSRHNLTDRLTLDVGVRAYARTPRPPLAEYLGAPAYAEASARLAYRLTEALEVSLAGQNLLHERHAEASEARRSEIPRSVLVGLKWTPGW